MIFPQRLIYNSEWVAGVHSYVIRSIWWDRGAFVYFHPSLLSTSPPAVCIFFSASPTVGSPKKKMWLYFHFFFLLLQYFNHFSLYHLLSFCLQLCFFLYRQIFFSLIGNFFSCFVFLYGSMSTHATKWLPTLSAVGLLGWKNEGGFDKDRKEGKWHTALFVCFVPFYLLYCVLKTSHICSRTTFSDRETHTRPDLHYLALQLQKLLGSHTIVTHLSFARNVFEGCAFTVRKGLLGYCMQLLPKAILSVAVNRLFSVKPGC